MLARILRLGVCSALLALGLGCSVTTGSARPGPLGLDARQSSWANRVFGRPPDLVSVFRPYPGMDAQKLEMDLRENTLEGFATLHCRQADTYFYGDVDRYLKKDGDDFDDGVIVLHGVPPWLDPLRPPRGDAVWAYEGQSGAGVRAYHEKSASKFQARLFVLPSATWVLSHGAVGDHLARVLAADDSEPPPLDVAPGAFIQETRRVDPALRADLAKLGWNPELKDLERLEAGGMVVYPIVRGRPLVLGLELVFSDEDTARDAAAEAARDPRLHNPSFVGIDRVGSVVVLKALESRP